MITVFTSNCNKKIEIKKVIFYFWWQIKAVIMFVKNNMHLWNCDFIGRFSQTFRSKNLQMWNLQIWWGLKSVDTKMFKQFCKVHRDWNVFWTFTLVNKNKVRFYFHIRITFNSNSVTDAKSMAARTYAQILQHR